jgi:excisionase family DNA binding protein
MVGMPGLSGMKAICSYVNRSEVTVLKWIRELRFPSTKIGGGIWESDTELIDRWRRQQIEVDDATTEEPWLTTSEAAAALGSSDSWVRQQIASGRLPAEKQKGKWRIKKADLIISNE